MAGLAIIIWSWRKIELAKIFFVRVLALIIGNSRVAEALQELYYYGGPDSPPNLSKMLVIKGSILKNRLLYITARYFQCNWTNGSLTLVKHSQSTGVMSILFSYPKVKHKIWNTKSCTRPAKLSIQGLQENKAYVDEHHSCFYIKHYRKITLSLLSLQ
jgi:hypothetical protein